MRTAGIGVQAHPASFMLKNFSTWLLLPRVLSILLAVSVLTNIVWGVSLFYPDLAVSIRQAMEPPPRVEPLDHVRGNPNAKVTVIVYTDFECPYCTQLHEMLLTLAKETDFRLVYRHFPLQFHQHAQRAAEAAECASAQNRFWEYSDALFKSTKKVSSDAGFIQMASNLGLDIKLFTACLTSGHFSSRVAAQRAEGLSRNLMAVPTFFVNGKRINGVIPMDELKSLLLKKGA